jgi:hypothetical protein
MGETTKTIPNVGIVLLYFGYKYTFWMNKMTFHLYSIFSSNFMDESSFITPLKITTCTAFEN